MYTARLTGINPNTGLQTGGYPITITGFDFDPLQTCLFGTYAASVVTVQSSTEMVCTAPNFGSTVIALSVASSSSNYGTATVVGTLTFTPSLGMYGYTRSD